MKVIKVLVNASIRLQKYNILYKGLSMSCGPNVRPAFSYAKLFVYNSVAICLIMIKLLHHPVEGPLIYCEKFQEWMRRTFGDIGR